MRSSDASESFVNLGDNAGGGESNIGAPRGGGGFSVLGSDRISDNDLLFMSTLA